MEERNLYAPPKASVAEQRQSDCTRDGRWVVVGTGSDLPPRCILCNEPAQLPAKTIKIYWHSPWIYVLILLNILLYAIVGLIARRSASVSPGLCAVHSATRKRRIIVSTIVFGLFLAAGIALVANGDAAMGVTLFTLSLITLVVMRILTRKVYAKRITKEYATLGGCKEPFLASL